MQNPSIPFYLRTYVSLAISEALERLKVAKSKSDFKRELLEKKDEASLLPVSPTGIITQCTATLDEKVRFRSLIGGQDYDPAKNKLDNERLLKKFPAHPYERSEMMKAKADFDFTIDVLSVLQSELSSSPTLDRFIRRVLAEKERLKEEEMKLQWNLTSKTKLQMTIYNIELFECDAKQQISTLESVLQNLKQCHMELKQKMGMESRLKQKEWNLKLEQLLLDHKKEIEEIEVHKKEYITKCKNEKEGHEGFLQECRYRLFNLIDQDQVLSETTTKTRKELLIKLATLQKKDSELREQIKMVSESIALCNKEIAIFNDKQSIRNQKELKLRQNLANSKIVISWWRFVMINLNLYSNKKAKKNSKKKK